MITRIGVGVIGMGWMGFVHSRAYRMIADRFPESGLQASLLICADEIERTPARPKSDWASKGTRPTGRR